MKIVHRVEVEHNDEINLSTKTFQNNNLLVILIQFMLVKCHYTLQIQTV